MLSVFGTNNCLSQARQNSGILFYLHADIEKLLSTQMERPTDTEKNVAYVLKDVKCVVNGR